MDQPTLTPQHLPVRELQDGQAVDAVYEVRDVTRRQKKNGEPFLKLVSEVLEQHVQLQRGRPAQAAQQNEQRRVWTGLELGEHGIEQR